MKKRTKILAPILAGSMILAACGGGDDDGGDTTEAASDTEGETTEAPSDTEGETEESMAEEGETEESMAEEGDTEESMAEGEDDGEAMADGEMKVDNGVDAENKVIKIGINGDLSGPFSTLTSQIVDAQEVYFDRLNAAGGINGWTIETTVLDSGYDVAKAQENYAELVQDGTDGVLMISENTGSPITSSLAGDAANDNMLIIPTSWASLWPDPEIGRPVIERQTTYCNEAINAVEWLKGFVEEQGQEPTLAIISLPGEYGEDGAAGAKIAAEELGIEVVYDGTGAIAGDDLTPVVSKLIEAQPTMVFNTMAPGQLTQVFGGAVTEGLTAYWTGSSPTFEYNQHLGGDFADQFSEYYYHSSYSAPWATEGIPEMEVMIEAMKEAKPDLPISDVYTIGWIGATITETILTQAIADGDLTREHVYSIPASDGFEVDYGGLAAPQSWPDNYNDAVVRSSWIFDVDAASQNIINVGESTPEDPGSSGLIPIEQDYVGSIAEGYEWTEPCIEQSS